MTGLAGTANERTRKYAYSGDALPESVTSPKLVALGVSRASSRSSSWTSEMRGAFETKNLPAIRSAWGQVFCSNDPFAWAFRPQFSIGRIFYPTDGYHLTNEQFLAVRAALEEIGETGFFVSIVESNELSFLDRSWGHWVCETPSYEDYCHLPLTLGNAIYSKEGRWGVLISHELHAVIAGSTEFMAGAGSIPGIGVADHQKVRECDHCPRFC